MLKIGVTGGIGCGKSAVTDYLSGKGIVIADADQAAKVIVEPGQPALKTIVNRFGSQILLDDGTLNRRALRDIIFNDPEQRRWLEQLTHPLVIEKLRQELATAQSPYVILVAPLLLEANLKGIVDRVLVIDTDPEQQIARTMARDGVSRTQVESILQAQASRAQRLSMADDIIDNSGSLDALHQQLDALHQRYLAMV